MLQKFRTLIIILAFSAPLAVLAQGSISGNVKDAHTGEAIIGANVLIQGTQIGASTDLEGNFLINKVAEGNYTLLVSFVTYKTHVIQNVVVENGKRVTIEVSLSEDVSELKEVVVSGTRHVGNDFSLIGAIRESKLVVTGVSSEMIIRTPDRDAAEVVKRIPGVSIMGGRFINVRGLSERYNVAMLNNAYAPSMESDRRSFAFDIIPSGQIDQLLVFKSPSPELPGDFAGGVVKIITKSIPDENNLTVGYAMGYRTGTTGEDFLFAERKGSQMFGFNSGSHDLPSDFPKDVRLLSETQRARAGRTLNNEWVPQKNNAFLDQSFSINGGVKFQIKNIEVGNITAVNLSQSRTSLSVSRRDFDQYDFSNKQADPRYAYVDNQNNLNVRLGIIHNWAFKLNDKNTIEFKNLFNQINNSQYIYRTGLDYTNSNNGLPQAFGGFSDIYRGVYSGQLLGKHKLNESKTTINWVLNTSNSFRDLPDMRRYRRDIDPSTGVEATYIPQGSASTFNLGRFFSKLNESSYSGSVSLDHTFEITDKILPVFSAGAFFELKSRNFNARNIGYVRGLNFDDNLKYLPIGQLFSPVNIDGNEGLQLDEQTNKSDSYDAKNKLLTYYTSISIPLGKFNFSGGVRVENNEQSLASAELTGEEVNQTNKVTRVLPSGNLSYNFSEKMLIRTTYGQTLNRPEFREIAPFGFYDFEYNWVISGNPDLKTAKINNYDVRWEFYPSKSEIITIGGFYKNFTNPIEMNYVIGGGSVSTFSFKNAGSAKSYGVELEVRKSLKGLITGKFFENINVLFNTTLIKSEVQVGNQPMRQLMGQSPYVINSGLYYNNEENGWQVTLLYNVAGRRLFAVGGYTDAGIASYENIYEMPRNVLDLSVTKRIKERLQVKLSVSDILNQKYVLLQDGNNDGKYSKTSDQIIQSNRYGSLYTLGLSYKVW